MKYDHVANRPSLINMYNKIEVGYYCMSIAARSWCSDAPPTPRVPRVVKLNMNLIASYPYAYGLEEPPPYEDNDDESKSTNRSVLCLVSHSTSQETMLALVTYLFQ